MPFRPLRRLCALTGALLIGTVGLGMTTAAAAGGGTLDAATAAPVAPVTAPAAPELETDGLETDGAEQPTGPVRVIVLLEDQPTTLSTSQEKGRLAAQEDLIAEWGPDFELEADTRFGYLVNGFAATIPAENIGALALEPEVASVRRERLYEPTETTARGLQGVPAAFAEHGVDGTGMVISVIDSGVDPSHQDMRLDDCDAAAIQDVNPAPEAGFTCKVPDGYNYADENFEVTDVDRSAHGQHVAGIAAANGSEGDEAGDVTETGRVDGVAPNAQVLAMKVFSDHGGGAQDSDIVAAIEDSVKLDADVVNLSLGSSNGQKNSSDATAIALEAARDAGVLPVIAAGNDGQNFSTAAVDDDALGLLDDGTVGSPGTQGSALTVASIENGVITRPLAYAEGVDPIPYVLATGDPDAEEHPLVDIGLARTQDVEGLELGGAYALIERGEISFTEKYENALAAGAGGIVIFNSEAGGEATFGMAGVEVFSVPGIVIPRSAGLALREIPEDSRGITVTEDLSVEDNPEALQPSDFTSWGTTPTLDFEPEIAGIGGNVYSTYNGDTYGLNSGTSMAAPNVAGMSALLFEHLAESSPEVTGSERVDRAKILLMNTAQVPEGTDGVPVSPRRTGAGLARIDRALDSQVLATVDGQGGAALREVSGSASFEITLTNLGDQDREFAVPSGQDVLAETNEPGAATTTRVSGGTMTSSAGTVTVPAGGTASVTVTITPEGGSDHFVGGYVSLASGADDQPDLSVPYLGFAGDWNEEPIVLAPGEDLLGGGSGVTTELVSSLEGSAGTLALDQPELELELALSPNGDGNLDTLGSALVLQRNASDLEYTIREADGETEVDTIGQEQGAYRPLLSDYLAETDPASLRWTGASYDGGVYDPQDVEVEALPDGEYVYEVRARLGEDYLWQEVEMPFTVDTTAPVVELGALEGGVLPFTVREDGSGLFAAPVVTTASGEELEVSETAEGEYAVAVDEATAAATPFVTVEVYDNGLNRGSATEVMADSTLLIAGEDTMTGGVLGPDSPLVQDGELQLTGFASGDVAVVRVDGGEGVEVVGGEFSTTAPLAAGEQEVLVEGLDDDGEVVVSRTLAITYDDAPPELVLDDGVLDADGAVVPSEDGSVIVRGTVTDERQGAELSVRVGESAAEVDAEGRFTLTVTPAEDAAVLTVIASDGANEAATALPIAGREAAGGWALPEFTNVTCVLGSAICEVPADSEDVSEDGSTFTLRGSYPAGGTITITPGARATDDGYEQPEPISVDIAEDGTFAADLPVQTGDNQMRVEITDAEGTLRYDRGVRFYLDVTAPTLRVDEPTLVGGTLYTDREDVLLSGSAEDDGWGYGFAVNGDVVIERTDWTSVGPDSNRREFSTEITVADGDTLLVEFWDPYGNTLLGLIPVVVDREGPEVAASIEDGDTLDPEEQISVTATDPNLAALIVTDEDGQVLDGQVTPLSTQQGPLEDALVDLEDLAAEEDGTGADEGDAAQPAEGSAADGENQQSAPQDGSDGSEGGDATEGSEATEEADAIEEGGAAEGSEDAEPTPTVQALGASTLAAETELEAVVDAADLGTGTHTLSVLSTDLAGNTTTETYRVTVLPELGIEGPESLELEVEQADLADQPALAERVLAEFAVTLDGEPVDADALADQGLALSLAPGTVLVPGEQEITVVVTDDANGRTASTVLTVTVTLADTGTGEPGDGDGSDDGDGSGGGSDGEDDGSDGGSDGGDGSDGGSGNGSGSGSGTGGTGSGADGGDGAGSGSTGSGTSGSGSSGSGSSGSDRSGSDTSGSPRAGTGPLARTGAEIGALAVAAAVLLLIGGGLVLRRRR